MSWMRIKRVPESLIRTDTPEIAAGIIVVFASLFIFPAVHGGNLMLQVLIFTVLPVLRFSPLFAVIPLLIASVLWHLDLANHSMLSGVLVYISIEYAISRGRPSIAGFLAAQWLVFGYVVTRNMSPRLDDLPGVLFELLCFSGAIGIGYLRASTNRKHKHQQAAQQRLQHDLRTNIARYLHDNIARTLTMISMHSELAGINARDIDTQHHLGNIADSSRSAIEDLHQLVTHLMYTDPVGTETMMGSWNTASVGTSISTAVKMFRNAGYNIDYTGINPDLRLPRDVETAFALAFNEVTANLVKHAPPNSDIEISAVENFDYIIILVSNSYYPELNTRSVVGSGTGIDNITARMRTVSGYAKFSTTEELWQVTLLVPLIHKRENNS